MSHFWPMPLQETLPHEQVGLVQIPVGSLLFFLWVLVHARFCLCLPRVESPFLSVLWKSYNQSCWPSKSDSLEIPSSYAGSPGWEVWPGAQNLHNSGRTSLVLFFSSLWVAHSIDVGFDFIMIAPLLLSCCSFSFVFGNGVTFLVCSRILGFPWWLSGKESACNAGDPSLIPGSRGSPGEVNCNPL